MTTLLWLIAKYLRANVHYYKYSPYSFSKINTHQQCPRKFKYIYVDKAPRLEEPSIPLAKGKFIHLLLEHHGDLQKVKQDKEFKEIVAVLGKDGIRDNYKIYTDFKKSAIGKKFTGFNEVFTELKLGLSQDLEFFNYDSYKDPNLLLRGYIDAGFEVNNRLLLVDWKTGKIPNTTNWGQLLYYSIGLFSKMPYDEIVIAYVYIEHQKVIHKKVTRKNIMKYKKALLDSIEPIEEDVHFKKNETALCDWCPFQGHCQNDGTWDNEIPF